MALASQPRTRQRAGSHWKEEARATLFSTFNSRIQPWLEYHRTGRRRRTPFCVAISFTSRDLKGTPPYGTQPGEAEVLAKIQSLRSAGRPLLAIARTLNAQGIRPRRGILRHPLRRRKNRGGNQ